MSLIYGKGQLCSIHQEEGKTFGTMVCKLCAQEKLKAVEQQLDELLAAAKLIDRDDVALHVWEELQAAIAKAEGE